MRSSFKTRSCLGNLELAVAVGLSVGLTGCFGNKSSFSTLTQSTALKSAAPVPVNTPSGTPSNLPAPLVTPTPSPSPTPAVSATPTPTPTPSNSPTGTPVVICDPLSVGGGASVGAQAGLIGELRAWNRPSTTAAAPANFAPFVDPATSTQVSSNLYLSKVDVPERKFADGFVASDGTLLRDGANKILTEYFYIKLRSVAKLGGSTTLPGLYQFAIISDDGSVLDLETGRDLVGNAVLTRVIDNNRVTSSRLVVADRAVSFDAAKRLSIELQYFQGPKYHIAFQLLWRKVNSGSGSDLYEPLNGAAGVGYFFDSLSTPSIPTAKFTELLSRGWKVLEPQNFELPVNTMPNPCATPGP